jgi:hypothetical protein
MYNKLERCRNKKKCTLTLESKKSRQHTHQISMWSLENYNLQVDKILLILCSWHALSCITQLKHLDAFNS